MDRTPVTSSNITSIGYDSETSTLEVEFHQGGVYQYFDVPSFHYDGIMHSGSHNGYLEDFIKGKFKYKKVGYT